MENDMVNPILKAVALILISGCMMFLSWLLLLIWRSRPLYRQLAESEAFNRSIINTAADSIISIDANGLIRSFNPSAEKMFGYQPKEVLGMSLKTLLPDIMDSCDHSPFGHMLSQNHAHIASTRCELEGVTRGGTRLPVEINIGECVMEDCRHLTIIIRDIRDRKQAEAEIRHSEERNRLLVETAGNAILVLDEAFRITEWNRAAEQLFGWRRDEVYLKPCKSFLSSVNDSNQAIRNSLARVLREESYLSMEATVQNRQGQHIRLLWNLSRLPSISGQSHEIIAIGHDITQRKKAEEAIQKSEARYRLLVDNLSEGIWVMDSSGITTFVNRQMAHFLNCSIKDLLDTSMIDYIDIAEIHKIQKLFALCQQGIRQRYEMELKGKNNKKFFARISFTPVTNVENTFAGVLAGVVDITAHKAAKDKLKEAARRKDEFIALLAHELRNPLMPILNALQLMERASNNPDIITKSKDIIDKQIWHMVRLIDDLLDISRLTRGKINLHFKNVSLHRIFDEVVSANTPPIEKFQHTLEISLPEKQLWLKADPVRLSQILSNLLQNAAKFTPPGGKIWLSGEGQGDHIFIKVKDSGVGIPEKHQECIFEMFNQGDYFLSQEHGGLGVGLHLTKRLVEMHHGTIQVFSAGKELGSEFTIQFPRLRVDSPAVEMVLPQKTYQVPTPDNQIRCRVLVVDDNQDTTQTLSQLLQLMGHEVQVAQDGKAALDAAKQFKPEAVLLDIGMPGMNGYEVARCLRADYAQNQLLLIALTGWGQKNDRQQAQEAGFDIHMTKPANPTEIERLIKTFKRSRSLSA